MKLNLNYLIRTGSLPRWRFPGWRTFNNWIIWWRRAGSATRWMLFVLFSSGSKILLAFFEDFLNCLDGLGLETLCFLSFFLWRQFKSQYTSEFSLFYSQIGSFTSFFALQFFSSLSVSPPVTDVVIIDNRKPILTVYSCLMLWFR